jgi:hypothetical protein
MSKNRKSGKGSVAPILRPKTKRLRGVPFKPGNRYGIATRFQPGNNANPGGRPSCKAISEALRFIVALAPDELRRFVPQTAAEKMAHGAVLEATKRKLGWFSEVADRTEGKPRIAADITTHDPLTELLAEVQRMSTQMGPPEGMPKQEEDAE